MSQREEVWFDAPEIAAEFIARTGLIDPILTKIWVWSTAVPALLGEWLGVHLHTPRRGPCPDFHRSAGESWTGVVVIQANEPTLWCLAKGGRDRPPPSIETPPWERVRQPAWIDEDEFEISPDGRWR